MAPDLFVQLKDIRDNVGLYAILSPDVLKGELSKREIERAESISMVMEEAHDQFITTRTKPRLNELKNLAGLISTYIGTEPKWTLNVLNDFNDCIFGM